MSRTRPQSLNPEQLAAVEHGEGPLLILAGAGSGKTRALTARIASLIDDGGVRPSRILAMTFTNKAAGVMRERIAGLLGEEPHGLWTGTFHSVAARILRREAERLDRDRAFSIYDEADAERALKQAMEEAGVDPQRWSPRAVRSRISSAKNMLVAPAEYAGTAFDLLARRASEVYPIYERILRRSNAFDFDDLLVHTVRLLEGDEEVRLRYADRFRHVLVDEYQDTNHAQYRMVRALASVHGNVCVVGDDDQSIYGWRGADLRNILDFERDYPGTRVIRLEQNYRSTASILEVANEVIALNEQRKPKRLRTDREAGERVRLVQLADEREEARWTVREIQGQPGGARSGDCAVLYRTNAQARAYEDALRAAGLPYRVVGGIRFYERREVKDVLAYLQLAVNPADEAAFLRAVSWPRRGVGDVTLERLRAAAAREGISLLQAASRAPELEELPAASVGSLASFADEIEGLAAAQREATAEEAIRDCLGRFGVLAALEAEEDGGDRIENVMELLAAAANPETAGPDVTADETEEGSELERYLQSLSLRSDIDAVDLDEDAVTLMTLHNAKGLEFPVVFIGGLEEGLFPLSRAEDVEEERRLFYVGVTRAMDRLYLTTAARRWRYGSSSPSSPSPFLEELPEERVERQIVPGAGASFGSSSRRRRREERPARHFPWRRDPAGGDGRAGEAPAEDGGLVYDYEDSQLPFEIEEGSRVVHPRFGEGVVRGLSGRGRRARAEIEFEDGETKKLMVAYAGLRPA